MSEKPENPFLKQKNRIPIGQNADFLRTVGSEFLSAYPDLKNPKDLNDPKPSWAPKLKKKFSNSSSAEKEPLKKESFCYRHLLRTQGFYYANTNPLKPAPPLALALQPKTPEEEVLCRCYTGTLSIELPATLTQAQEDFLCDALEQAASSPKSPLKPWGQDRVIFNLLLQAFSWEKMLEKFWPGLKRFSLEGADSLLAGLFFFFKQAAALGVTHSIIGTTHRGRLNVLHTLFDCPLQDLFDPAHRDVVYHQGRQTSKHFGDKELKLSLLPNPSHLGATVPVTLGFTRALQDAHLNALAIIIHGDAGFVGQGIVNESLLLSSLGGYQTSGTIHVILNNQIGFTSSLRETWGEPEFATKSVQSHSKGAPIIHVNGQDPEAVIRAFHLAFSWRQTFKKDCIINLWCYRKHGHNELDDPRITHPLLYKKIHALQPLHRIYGKKIGLSDAEIDAQEAEFKTQYKALWAEENTKKPVIKKETLDCSDTLGEQGQKNNLPTQQQLKNLGTQLTTLPQSLTASHFLLHPVTQRMLEKRRAMLTADASIDWSFAEILALGSCIQAGVSVRLSGQDAVRGTFSQRHAHWVCQDTGRRHSPLEFLSLSVQTNETQTRQTTDPLPQKAPLPPLCQLVNSPLSEAAALGFEVGYSWGCPGTLVLWEAQFGDFANGAQVQIDQYISAAEKKWGQQSGLVLLLPHGLEGQGPEHASARIERFLQLAAKDNMRVACPSQPASYFHLLRDQAYRRPRKPLIVFTPKSCLRHPLATSALQEFSAPYAFQPLLPYVFGPKNTLLQKVIFCTGKVGLELRKKIDDNPKVLTYRILIVCFEQLFPLPCAALRHVLSQFLPASERTTETEALWVQEEPKNMGAWSFISAAYPDWQPSRLSDLKYCGRPASCTAGSSHHTDYKRTQDTLLARALGWTQNEK